MLGNERRQWIQVTAPLIVASGIDFCRKIEAHIAQMPRFGFIFGHIRYEQVGRGLVGITFIRVAENKPVLVRVFL